MSYKGFFRPRNPSKYKGDSSNICWRSTWELKLMNYLDAHPDIIYWSSEEICIPYRSPIDGRMHRYFPDFIVKKKSPDGKLETMMIEVKPSSQTKPPTPRKGGGRKYISEVTTWGINSSKWKAANEYCKDRNWTFKIFTEKELGIISRG